MNRRDYRYRQGLKPVQDFVRRESRASADTGAAGPLDVAQVEPRAKPASFPFDDHGTDFVVALDHGEGRVERFQHRDVDRVAFFGAVEREGYIVGMTFDF